MKLVRLVSAYRWPLYVSGLLAMPIVATGVLVFVATRPDSPRPMKDYYETALRWDADEAVEAASRQLGWTVRYVLPADVPHFPGMPRPVDVRVVDREGKGVTGLGGRLFALRPAEPGRSQTGSLTALPQDAGTYRTLVLMDQPGLWELRLDVTRDALRFVHAARVTVPSDAPSAGGDAR